MLKISIDQALYPNQSPGRRKRGKPFKYDGQMYQTSRPCEISELEAAAVLSPPKNQLPNKHLSVVARKQQGKRGGHRSSTRENMFRIWFLCFQKLPPDNKVFYLLLKVFKKASARCEGAAISTIRNINWCLYSAFCYMTWKSLKDVASCQKEGNLIPDV